MKLSKLMLAIGLSILLFSCDDDDSSTDIGNTQSAIGEVGNSFNMFGLPGVSSMSATVTKLENGVSTISCSGNVTDDIILAALQAVDADLIPGTISMTNNEISADINLKITEGGVQSIFSDGKSCTIVNYKAGVGDKYSIERGGKTLEAEVISKSKDDDYAWGGMLIKVIKVKNKSIIPGISDVISIYNHRFGLVGLEINFEDGSSEVLSISSFQVN